MTGDRRVREALIKAVNLIVSTQNPEGGWRYHPRPVDADISVTICQVMALRSARNAGINVPKETIERAITYVRQCQNTSDGGFRYMLHSGGSAFPRSAAGVASLYYAGVYEDEALTKGLAYLLEQRRGATGRFSHYFYGHYYAVQAMFLAGGQYWERWYPQIRHELLEQQTPAGGWSSDHGDVYATSMALLILQIPNRLLPIFQGETTLQPSIHSGKCDSHRSANRAVLACAILLTWLATTRVSAVTGAVLIDTELEPHQVKIQGLVDGVISYFDADRRLQVEPMSQFVQVRIVKDLLDPVPSDTPADTHPTDQGGESTDVIELVDGQRLIGKWVGVDEQSQTLIWHHPLLGGVQVSLDRLSVLGRSAVLGVGVQGALPTTDEIELVNDDRVSGYVVGVNLAGIEFQLEEGGHVLEIALDQIRTLRLANPVVRRQNGRSMVWLSDGSRVLAESINIATDQIAISASLTTNTHANRVSLPMSQVERIDWSSAGGYLVDLTDLSWRIEDERSVFGLAVKPRVEETSFLLHAPVKVVFTLPPGAQRFRALAQSGDGFEPKRAVAWMDFEVVVTVDGKTSCREHLHADRRSVVLNVAASGQTMTIELDPAINGPIMDRLSLRDAVVFVRSPFDEDAD